MLAVVEMSEFTFTWLHFDFPGGRRPGHAGAPLAPNGGKSTGLHPDTSLVPFTQDEVISEPYRATQFTFFRSFRMQLRLEEKENESASRRLAFKVTGDGHSRVDPSASTAAPPCNQ